MARRASRLLCCYLEFENNGIHGRVRTGTAEGGGGGTRGVDDERSLREIRMETTNAGECSVCVCVCVWYRRSARVCRSIKLSAADSTRVTIRALALVFDPPYPAAPPPNKECTYARELDLEQDAKVSRAVLVGAKEITVIEGYLSKVFNVKNLIPRAINLQSTVSHAKARGGYQNAFLHIHTKKVLVIHQIHAAT